MELAGVETNQKHNAEYLLICPRLKLRVTAKGWAALRTETPQTSLTVFVAMRFKPEFDDLYSLGLSAGVKAAGFEPIRVDRTTHVNRIDDQILLEIQRSRFVVVDTTEHNSNTLFEAGYALGLGKIVIWACRRGDETKLDFDFRQYNQMPWDGQDLPDFAARLSAAIEQLVGRGVPKSR
ncbi:MAG: hypothetical protein LC623_00350 [Halobacteriales archaeon]|nr:hypothetical protein [Halobacteriales archaeon]